MLKVGVVGLGFMGSTHLQAYQNVPGAELVAVVSSDPRKREGDLSDVQGNLGISGQKMDFSSLARYSSPDELFQDPNVEAVDLCVPSRLHAFLAIQALEAGKHVLVEKPMGLNDDECQKMIDVARQNDRVLMVAQVLRFWPEYVVLRQLKESGELGKVQSVLFRRRCAAPTWGGWLQDASESGGGAFDLLIHDFDFCIHLLGEPGEVSGIGVEEGGRGIDFLEARLQYDSPLSAIVTGGWHHPESYPFSMEYTAIFDEGTVEFHSECRPLTLYRVNGEKEELAKPEEDGFVAELTAFLEACRENKTPALCDPRESRRAVMLTLAALESREKNGQTISFS